MNACCTRQEITLKSLLASLEPLIKAAKTPTPRALRETAGEPVREIPGLRVYRNGYAVYDNGSGRTVLWVPDCRTFTFCFQPLRETEKNDLPEKETIPPEVMDHLPWYIPLTLTGDHRVEYNHLVHQSDLSLEEDPSGRLLNAGSGWAGREGLRIGSGYRPDEDPEAFCLRREARSEMLGNMTARQREAFELYWLEGYNQYEIAEKLGLSRSAVTRLLRRAIS